MRIIDYYNYICMAAFILMAGAAIFMKRKDKEIRLNDRITNILLILIILVAAVIRIFRLDSIPLGLQQDEASIGYEAYILANFGIDRNGYSWPIYPITWGCGGGSPLLIYLNVISIKLFGTGIFKLRLIPAICGVMTVFLFYLSLRISFENNKNKNAIALFGAAFLAVCPWHVILSRWSLDCNIMPFNMMLGLYLFLIAHKKKSTVLYCLSSAAFAVCMYSYGAATIVIPVFLVLFSTYCLVKKEISVNQLVLAIIVFVVVFAPLLWFYSVNYLGVPEFISEVFCVNRFTADRTGEALVPIDSLPTTIIRNLKSMLLSITIGDESHTLMHFFPGYGTLYKFTFPITFLGLFLVIKRKFKIFSDALFTAFLFACTVLNMIIVPDTSRMVMMFIPFIYFLVIGMEFVIDKSHKLFVVAALLLMFAAISFSKDYFMQYSTYATSIFMPGYGEAIKRAYEITGDDNTIYSTYDGLSAPFMLALYYNEYDPYKFIDSVVYKDEKAEFRIAESFGNFIFSLPEDINADGYIKDVFVLSSNDLSLLSDASLYNVEDYCGYHVVYKK
ncbi:ArnT family glycosyltransferase [Butyrivibrio sp. YAB3001]|uniref:ArnT family glycosyltransferase n=1 Tax=Butyrivibrio sp. YAB3001 TaxID=1520812 RepID=UPI0008F6620F|nr:glycosyltransferase family 39 protein [Butyrivibrio sp. YAB3001]SFC37650.1 Dolichyl-phosphate-mannose-protein mannosyltransferase [Butyrivibrio sp. YAB3001]